MATFPSIAWGAERTHADPTMSEVGGKESEEGGIKGRGEWEENVMRQKRRRRKEDKHVKGKRVDGEC